MAPPCEASASLHWVGPMTSRRSVPQKRGWLRPVHLSTLLPGRARHLFSKPMVHVPCDAYVPWSAAPSMATCGTTADHGCREGSGPVSTLRGFHLTPCFEEQIILSTLPLAAPPCPSLFSPHPSLRSPGRNVRPIDHTSGPGRDLLLIPITRCAA